MPAAHCRAVLGLALLAMPTFGHAATAPAEPGLPPPFAELGATPRHTTFTGLAALLPAMATGGLVARWQHQRRQHKRPVTDAVTGPAMEHGRP